MTRDVLSGSGFIKYLLSSTKDGPRQRTKDALTKDKGQGTTDKVTVLVLGCPYT